MKMSDKDPLLERMRSIVKNYLMPQLLEALECVTTKEGYRYIDCNLEPFKKGFIAHVGYLTKTNDMSGQDVEFQWLPNFKYGKLRVSEATECVSIKTGEPEISLSPHVLRPRPSGGGIGDNGLTANAGGSQAPTQELLLPPPDLYCSGPSSKLNQAECLSKAIHMRCNTESNIASNTVGITASSEGKVFSLEGTSDLEQFDVQNAYTGIQVHNNSDIAINNAQSRTNQHKLKPSSIRNFHFPYDTDISEDKKMICRLRVKGSNFVISPQNKNDSPFEVTINKKNQYITVKRKESFGSPIKLIDCFMFLCGTLEKVKLEVLIISDKESYLHEILIQGLIGARKLPDINLIQFGKYIFEVDFYDFYVYGIVAVVFTPGIEPAHQWPWKNENNVPVEPPDNELATYKDLITRISDLGSFFSLLGQANLGEFSIANLGTASKTDCQLILAFTFSEVVRNFLVLTDNEKLYQIKDTFKDTDSLKSFLDKFYTMNAIGTFCKRQTGFSGSTTVSRNRRKLFDTEVNLRI